MFLGATGLTWFAMIGNVRVKRLLGTSRKVKISRGSAHYIEQCFWTRGSSLLRLDEGLVTALTELI